MMRMVCNEKEKTIGFFDNGRIVYTLQCCNIVHFYAARYAAKQCRNLKGLDHELLKPIK